MSRLCRLLHVRGLRWWIVCRGQDPAPVSSPSPVIFESLGFWSLLPVLHQLLRLHNQPEHHLPPEPRLPLGLLHSCFDTMRIQDYKGRICCWFVLVHLWLSWTSSVSPACVRSGLTSRVCSCRTRWGPACPPPTRPAPAWWTSWTSSQPLETNSDPFAEPRQTTPSTSTLVK